MKVTAVLTEIDGTWVAHCQEVDRAGEGSTPEGALASLREALEEYFSEPDAVAPPQKAAKHPIEIVTASREAGTSDPQ